MVERENGIVRAVSISTVCIFTYFVSYYLRNILGVATPEMLSSGAYTTELVGTLSSVYMLSYAVGQLVNGAIGDHIKPKYMASIGLLVGGIVTSLFPLIKSFSVSVLLFGVLGFSLSMLRGPLVKTICENTKSNHAHVACVFLSFVCNAGPLVASLFTIVFDWRLTFIAAGISAMFFAAVAFIILSVFEKRGLIISNLILKESSNKKSVLGLFKLEQFFFFMILGMASEIAHTTIIFWLPTYLSTRLSFDNDTANLIFSAVALIKALAPFASLVVLKVFRDNEIMMSRALFLFSGALFIGVLFVKLPFLNILFLILALFFIGMASTLLWSVYIPNQGKTGLVSTLNGFLDFSGYLAASAANVVFSFTMRHVGWGGIVGMWSGIAVFVFLMSLFVRKKKENG